MPTALCCFFEAYPPASGAASVSYNLAKFLPGRCVLVQLNGRGGRLAIDGDVEVVSLAGASESRLQRLKRLPGFVSEMVAEIQRADAGLVILEGASWAFYHWMLLRGIRGAVPRAKIVYHSHNVEYQLRVQRHNRAIATLTRWAEGRLLTHADVVTAVSQVDRDEFVRLYGVRPMLLPNGVDMGKFARPNATIIDRLRKQYRIDRKTMLFAGFYGYHPNREAIDFLRSQVMPAVRDRYPTATLAFSGGGAPYEDEWIRNVGSVPYDEFAPFVAACGIALAPIFSGSGTRLKILEAMAAGLPVVATRKAAEGLPVSDGEEILFAQDGGQFVNRIAQLFENPDLAQSLRARARLMVAKSFAWEAITERFARDVATL